MNETLYDLHKWLINFITYIFITLKLNYNNLYIFIILSAIGFGKNIPNWYLEGKLNGYSPKKYFVGIGEGKDYQKALENAGVYIASQMQISISSRLESSVSENSKNGKINSSESFREDIITEVNQSLPALEIIKNENVNGTVYVFAVLNKERYLTNINFELADISLSINAFLSNARKFSRKGNISKSFEDYKLVRQLISKLNAKKTFYNSLSSSRYFDDPSLNYATIEKEIDNLINDLKIEIVSGNNQAVTNGMLLPEPVIIRLYSQKYNNPILGAEILIKYSDGTLATRGMTDSNGKYEFFVYAYDDITGSKIEAVLSPKGLISPSKVKKAQVKTFISYRVQKKSPVTFGIEIFDQSGLNRLDYLERRIAKYIIKLGNEVSETASLIIKGKIYEKNLNEVTGKGGTQFLITSELNLSLNSKTTGKSFSTIILKGKGLSKKNKEDALIIASKKIKMNQRKIASLISSAEQQIKKENIEHSDKLLKQGLVLNKQGSYKEAISILAKVEYGDQNILKANEAIKNIQNIIEKIQKEKEENAEKLRKELLLQEVESVKRARLNNN